MKVLSHSCTVRCRQCPGVLQFQPDPARALTVSGVEVLTDVDVLAATVVGCTQSGSGKTPCRGVASILAGESEELGVGGAKPMEADLRVLTDGGPPQLMELASDGGSVLGRSTGKTLLSFVMLDTFGRPMANEALELVDVSGRVLRVRTDDEGRVEQETDQVGALVQIRREGEEAEEAARQDEEAEAARDDIKYYDVAAGVVVPEDPEPTINAMARQYYDKQKTKILITSGVRSAVAQARAMIGKLRAGDDLAVYRRQDLVREVKAAWRNGGGVSGVAAVIRAQVARGAYLSRHLTGRAIDVRSRGMSAAQKADFEAAATAHASSWVLERRPPHYHLQF